MGITGLLPLLKSIQKPCHLKKFAGQTIGVDVYGWLHRGAIACAVELALGKPTNKFVDYALNRVRMLKHFGVIPFLVFDGDYLPSKAVTEVQREKKREESRRLGLELLNMGKLSQAHMELQKSVDVTPEMARQLIDKLREQNINYIVAPYEADAQLVYMERKGIIGGILSEDSDMLVFGAKTLMTKLDQYGECIVYRRNDFATCSDLRLHGWSDTEFRQMAILSGCDYLPSINKMGLKTANRLIRKHKTIDKVIKILQFDGQYRVPTNYLEDFLKAELTFLHQRVFCPEAQKLIMAHELPVDTADKTLTFVGPDVPADVAHRVAQGDLHPTTKKPIISTSSSNPPKTPWAVSRRHTYANPTDLKPGVSINSFFKPKRMPLGELDPNSLTPSPSQQLLLARSTQTWEARPSPIHSALQRTRTSLPNSSAQQASPIEPGLHRNQQPASVPGLHLRKRQRLCEDVSAASVLLPSENASLTEGSTSRFFASKAADPSPLAFKRGQKTKEKESPVNIWSDDSLDQALAVLPDVSEGPAIFSTPKVAVYNDVETEINTKLLKTSGAGDSHKTVLTEACRSEASPTQFGSTTSQCTQSQGLKLHLEAKIIPNTPSKKALRNKLTNHASPSPKRGTIRSAPSINKSKSCPFDVLAGFKFEPTHAKCGDENVIPASPIAKEKRRRSSTSLSKAAKLSEIEDVDLAGEQQGQELLLATPTAPTSKECVLESPPLPPHISNRIDRTPKGSEDFIIPNSEDDSFLDYGARDDEGEDRHIPKLNLAIFTFTR
ncbi:Rad2 nuclease [Agyrium rufum]|nr:Rad2 nuclease [Agyrium rufum]